jgi:hypothetical protein
MAVLCMSASLFFLGCTQDPEIKYLPPEMFYIDQVVTGTNDTALAAALLEEPDTERVIEARFTSAISLTVTEIPAKKTVIFRSSGTPATTTGLTVKGTVYVGEGCTLTVATTTPVIVTTSIVNVCYADSGTLSAAVAASVHNGASVPTDADTVLGNTVKVSVKGGTLTYTGAGLTAAGLGMRLGYVTKGTLDAGAALVADTTPKAITDAATPKIAGKTLAMTATKDNLETDTSLVIPAGLTLTANESDDFGEVASIRVDAGGSFIAADATGDASSGLAVTANGTVSLGDVVKLKSSSVGAAGVLVLGDSTALDTANDPVITVTALGSVNGVVYPGATTITAIGDGELTITNLTVPAEWVFTVAEKLTVTGILAIEGDGSVVLTLAADKVILPAGSALDVKDKTGSFGEANQTDTKVTVTTDSSTTATQAAGVKNGTTWTVTTASSGSGTNFSGAPIILGTLKYATDNVSTAVNGTACAEAGVDATTGKLVVGTGTVITFTGDGA